MRPAIRRCALACLIPLALFATLAWPATPGQAARARHATATHPARLILVYGYLMDPEPAKDSVLKVYSKTHRKTTDVVMTAATIVKERGRIVPRAALRRGQYVIASCTRQKGGTLQAVRVSIVIRRARKKH